MQEKYLLLFYEQLAIIDIKEGLKTYILYWNQTKFVFKFSVTEQHFTESTKHCDIQPTERLLCAARVQPNGTASQEPSSATTESHQPHVTASERLTCLKESINKLQSSYWHWSTAPHSLYVLKWNNQNKPFFSLSYSLWHVVFSIYALLTFFFLCFYNTW